MALNRPVGARASCPVGARASWVAARPVLARAACLAALGWLAFWLSAEDLSYRWDPTLSRVYFGTHRDAGAIDLVVVGSSRTASGFDAHGFAEAYAERHGRELIVFDIARFARGPEVDYLTLRRLLAKRRVRHLLVEYQHGGLGPDALHPELHLAAGFGEISAVVWAQAHRPAWVRIQHILDLWVTRASGLAALAATGELEPIEFDPDDPAPARTRDPSSVADRARPERLKAAEARSGWRDAPRRVWDFDAPDAAREARYAHKIVALAKANGASVTFQHPNRLYEPPLDESVAHEFRERFGARLLWVPERQLERLYPLGYSDEKHLNVWGAKVWAEWLASELQLR